MAKQNTETTNRSVLAGVLSWLVPGAGHWYLGQRGLAVVLLVAVSFPYMVGLAYGGVLSSVNPQLNRWLYFAELGVGGYTLPLTLASRGLQQNVLNDLGFTRIPDQMREPVQYAAFVEAATERRYMSFFPESDIAQIYLATAGLLNLLVILDAVSRAQTGLPTFHRDMKSPPTEAAR